MDTDKLKWEETEEYQEFYKHWYDSFAGCDFPNEFPYELSLAVDLVDVSPSGKRILVTKSYDDMFHRLMHLRDNDIDGDAKGAVLIGQPGIGGYDQICVPRDNSSVDLCSRKIYLLILHACAAVLGSAGRAPM